MDDKFSAHYDSVEQEIKANTVTINNNISFLRQCLVVLDL
jgi:hypothetical protein